MFRCSMRTLKRCLNQVFRPEAILPKSMRKKLGIGNCLICQPSDDNKYCAYYRPIRVYFLDVKEKKES